MKKVVLIMVLAAVLAAPAFAGHTDSGCVGCHVPHGGSTNSDLDMPLWIGSGADSNQVGNFTMYTSTTYQGGAVTNPDGSSLMCLGCHDGATRLVGDPWRATGSQEIGIDLSGSHPISFTYATSAGADDDIYASSTPVSQLDNGTILATMLDGNGKLQCASCHDVHTSVAMSLKFANDDGALCKACHNK